MYIANLCFSFYDSRLSYYRCLTIQFICVMFFRPVHVSRFCNNLKHIFSAGDDKIVNIWDVATEQVITSYSEHQVCLLYSMLILMILGLGCTESLMIEKIAYWSGFVTHWDPDQEPVAYRSQSLPNKIKDFHIKLVCTIFALAAWDTMDRKKERC